MWGSLASGRVSGGKRQALSEELLRDANVRREASVRQAAELRESIHSLQVANQDILLIGLFTHCNIVQALLAAKDTEVDMLHQQACGHWPHLCASPVREGILRRCGTSRRPLRRLTRTTCEHVRRHWRALHAPLSLHLGLHVSDWL